MKYLIIIGVMISLAFIIAIEFSKRRRPDISTPRATESSNQKNIPIPADWGVAEGVLVRDGVFIDSSSKLAGKIPQGWVLQTSSRRGADETSLLFRQPADRKAALTLYYRVLGHREFADRTLAVDSLRKAVQAKTDERIAAGFDGYKVGPDIVIRDIHANPAISWTADYLKDGFAWKECITRIQGEKYTMLVFMMTPSTEIERVRGAYEELVSSTKFN